MNDLNLSFNDVSFSTSPETSRLRGTDARPEGTSVLKLAAGLLKPSANTPPSNFKVIVDELKRLNAESAAIAEQVRIDPNVRFSVLSKGMTRLHAQKLISLVVAERRYLVMSAQESQQGSAICTNFTKIKECGFIPWHDGECWRFKNLNRMPETAEGFAFFLPVLFHMDSQSGSTEILNLNVDAPENIAPLREFLKKLISHSDQEIKRLAIGYLAMLEFNEQAESHRKFYQLQWLPFMQRLLMRCTLFDDEELLSSLTLCAPLFYRLLLIDLYQMIISATDQIPQWHDASKETYGPKEKCHALARTAYLHAQNILFDRLISCNPKVKIRKSTLFRLSGLSYTEPPLTVSETFIPSPRGLANLDPYSVKEKPAQDVSRQVAEAKENGENGSMAKSGIACVLPKINSWMEMSQPFRYRGRARMWFRKTKEEETKLEKERVRRVFHLVVDKLAREECYASQQTNKYGFSFYLIAQFDFEDGKRERGIICYRTFDTSVKVRDCYHRQFLKVKEADLLQGSLAAVFSIVDRKVESKKERTRVKLGILTESNHGQQLDNGSAESVTEEKTLPCIDIDPMLGLIKIHDEENGVVISIFRLPVSSNSIQGLRGSQF